MSEKRVSDYMDKKLHLFGLLVFLMFLQTLCLIFLTALLFHKL